MITIRSHYLSFINIMSDSQQSLSSQQHVNPINVPTSSKSNSSEDDDESSKYSVRITSRINQIKKQSSSLRHFEQQIQHLKLQNSQLKEQNSKLVQFLNQTREDENIKRQLQRKDRQILQLRHQIASNNYYQSSSSCKPIQSAINVDIQDKRYKLRSKSKNQSKHKQSVASSVQDQTESVRLHVFDQLEELKKIKTDKLTLQKQFYELQEKMLVLEHEIKWMRNLAVKLVSMAQKISYIFKQRLFEERWELLKRAKVSWRYLKHILNYIFQIK